MKMKHLILAAAAIAALAAAPLSKGAVIFSGTVNIPIPTTFGGVDIDVDNQNDAPGSGPSVMTPFDVNFFFGGAGIQNTANFQPVRTGPGSSDPIANLAIGTTVDGTSIFGAGAGSSGGPIGLPPTHLGSGPDQFGVGEIGYIGFELIPDAGGGPLYGWMRVILTNNTGGGRIIDYAVETSPGVGIVVPEPSVGLLGMLVLGITIFRRRK